MPRSLLSTRPRSTRGVHRFRNTRIDYLGQTVSGLHVLIDLRRCGMRDKDILPLLERLAAQTERRARKRVLLAMPCQSALLQ